MGLFDGMRFMEVIRVEDCSRLPVAGKIQPAPRRKAREAGCSPAKCKMPLIYCVSLQQFVQIFNT